MTLNETFNMVKDGAVQDRRYKPGEISEATGLQKQPDGSWAEPKTGTKGAGIPKADKNTFVGKTYKDFAESARASGYTPKSEKENPDGSSSTVFSNKEGKTMRVDFDKYGKIQNVEAAARSQQEHEEKRNVGKQTMILILE